MVLLERAQELLDSDTLAPEDRQELEELTSAVLAAHSAGDADRLDALLEELLDLLFDLET
jgi:hypothetical protein